MQKKFLVNIFSLLLLQGGQYLLTLISLPSLARVLSPEGFGLYGLALALVQYGIIVTNYGFDLSATKQIASVCNDKKKVSYIFWNVLASKMILATIGFVCIFIFSFLFEKNDIYVMLCSSIQLLGVVIFPIWLFQGKEDLKVITISNLLARSSALPLLFIFVKKPDDILVAAIIQSLTVCVAGGIAFFTAIKKRYVVFLKINISEIIYQLKDGFGMFLANIAISLYTVSTIVIIGIFSNQVETGLFNGVDKIRIAFTSIFVVLTGAIYPRINSMISNNDIYSFSFIKKNIMIQGVLSAVCSVLIFVFSKDIIKYGLGEKYGISVDGLNIVSPTIFLITMSVIFSNYILLPFGYKKIFVLMPVVTAFLHILISIPLCHIYGFIGGCLSILITEIMTNIVLLILVAKFGLLSKIIRS